VYVCVQKFYGVCSVVLCRMCVFSSFVTCMFVFSSFVTYLCSIV